MTVVRRIVIPAIAACLVVVGCDSGEEKIEPSDAETSAGEVPAGAAEDKLTATVRRLVERLREDPDDEDAIGALAALESAAAPALRRALEDPDPEFRFAVVQALRQIPGQESLDALLVAFADSNEEVRYTAVEGLGERADRGSVPALLERYEIEDDDQVRYEILTSLGLIGDPSTAPFLVTESSSDDPYVRMWAADALCEMGANQAVDVAVRLLGDANEYVRKRVLAACGKALTRDDAVAGLIHIAVHGETFEESVRARRNLQNMIAVPGRGEVSQRLAAEAVASLDGDDALQAALVLADLNDTRGMDVLRRSSANPDPFVRHHIAFELGRLGGPKSVPPLIALLDDPVELVAATAHDALLNFADQGDGRAQKAVDDYDGKTFPTRLKDLAAAQGIEY